MPASAKASAPPPPLSGHDIREKFIRYFEQKLGHTHVKSASLVPADNPTVLLTPAGMLPFVPIFLGIQPPPTPPRAVSSQKCARVSGKASDLESVGRTPRHHTFFEMLGNFSFGDYFKKEIIPWAWAFLTQELGLPPERLWVSVFETDDEAYEIWKKDVGVPESRILRMGKKDNFWGPPGPTGPCGPCSEIYYDPRAGAETGALAFDDDLCVEIWNLVFMEFFQDAEGKLSPLEKKNVDTGMGLERIAMVLQNTPNTCETDLVFPIIEKTASRAGKPYGKNADADVALKIVADHVRLLVFALGDGVMPSNEGRGYVIRMILRRAVRYGQKYLGFDQPFLAPLVATVVAMYATAYPELNSKQSMIEDTLQREEEKFIETLDRGSKLLEDILASAKSGKKKIIPGEDVFKLYDTYGFPAELTADIAAEHGYTLDLAGFEAAMENQRRQARAHQKDKTIVENPVFGEILAEVGATEFLGYNTLSAEATVLALIVDGERVDSVGGTNTGFQAVLNRTPFYAESGGQVGDRGTFSREQGPHGLTVVVNDTVKVGDLFVHQCLFDNGKILRVGEPLLAQVEPVARARAAQHHTATHLLNAALRQVLGDGVNQAGSRVAPDGARFDFTLDRAMKPDEVQRTEFLMNKWILGDAPRTVEELPIDEAKASGAIAMFDEKYGDRVRVVSYGNVSRELCGGTHVEHLGQIGLVKLLGEGAIASGIRRIELVAGELAYKHFKQLEATLTDTAALLKVPPREVAERVQKLMDDLREKDKALAEQEKRLAQADLAPLLALPPSETGPFYVRHFSQKEGGAKSPEILKLLAEGFAAQKPAPFVLLLASNFDGKAQFVCAVSEDLIKQGIKAGDLVKLAASHCGGGGGGRPNLAQAGGGDAGKIPEALTLVEKALSEKGLATV